MKWIITSAVVILLATASVQAQTDTTKSPRYEHHEMQHDGGYKQLNLSADQQAKMKTVRDNFKQKTDALEAQKLTADERKAQLQTLHEQQRTQMAAILTPEQQTQLAKMRSDRDGSMADRKSFRNDSSMSRNDKKDWQGRDNKRGADFETDLNLTTEQQAKWKEIRTAFKGKAEALRNDTALSQEQKGVKMQELRKQQQEQLKTVLTKEQLEKMQAQRKEHTARNTK